MAAHSFESLKSPISNVDAFAIGKLQTLRYFSDDNLRERLIAKLQGNSPEEDPDFPNISAEQQFELLLAEAEVLIDVSSDSSFVIPGSIGDEKLEEVSTRVLSLTEEASKLLKNTKQNVLSRAQDTEDDGLIVLQEKAQPFSPQLIERLRKLNMRNDVIIGANIDVFESEQVVERIRDFLRDEDDSDILVAFSGDPDYAKAIEIASANRLRLLELLRRPGCVVDRETGLWTTPRRNDKEVAEDKNEENSLKEWLSKVLGRFSRRQLDK